MTRPPVPPRHLVLASFAGGNASTVTGPLEILDFAARQFAHAPPFEVSVITRDGAAVTCDGCVTITPVASIADARAADFIFLAGMPCNVDEVIEANAGILGWLAAEMARGVPVATVCPSQALLAHGGLLDGRTVAMHWSLIDEVRQRFPRVDWTAERMVVEDHGIYSCCGASATIDLTLYLVDRLCGRDTLLACAQWFLADLPRVRQNVPPPMLQRAGIEAGSMAAVESWILGHFHQPIHFERLAADFGMSWRTFYRRFQEAFGDPPKVYLQKLRLNAARRLLEHDNTPIDQVAARVGYADAAFFRTLFKRYVGMTPSRYRESFRFRSVAEA
ncbi:MAG: helix-turn-helix domain-containing protein [Gammaproteobacteria bacterium]|nr:helix-turn-helix domain-containing protein [Gammaproteobacteria bacterium]MCP5198834.1 helix-turn-helix domain-containing protein [Gammaproteobacteria bacterium]